MSATPARCLTFSRDEKLLASGHEDGTVRLSSTSESGSKERTLGKQTYPVQAVTFSENGKVLVSAGGEGQEREVVVWDMPEGKRRSTQRWKEQSPRCDGFLLALSPDGMTLAVRGDNDAKLRFMSLTASDKPPRVDTEPARAWKSFWWTLDHPAYAAVFSKDGKRLITAWCQEGKECIQMWDLEKRSAMTDPRDTGPSVLEGGDPDKRGFLWFNSDDPKLIHRDVRWVRTDGRLKWWGVGAVPTDLTIPPMHPPRLDRVVAYAPMGDFVIVATGIGIDATERNVLVRWVGSSSTATSWRTHPKGLFALALAPSGTRLATSGSDGIKLWTLPVWKKFSPSP